SSVSLSKASSASSVALKSGVLESSLRIILLTSSSSNSTGKGFDDRLQQFALEFERGLVDDKARGNRQHFLGDFEIVGLERAARGHEVDDGIGQADQRRQLHGAVELDQVDMHALGSEVFARSGDVLGRDA